MKNSWLLNAAEDASDSASLFYKKSYRNSLFLLQQSAEKASKGLLKDMELLGDEYQTGMVLWGKKIRLPSPKEHGVGWHRELFNFMVDFLDALESRANAYSPDAELVKKFILEFKKINLSFDKAKMKNLPKDIALLKAIKLFYNDMLLFSGDPEAIKKVKNIEGNRYSFVLFFVEPDVQRFLPFLKIFILYVLSSYLSQYESAAREPDFRINKRSTIIKNFGEIWYLIRDTINY